MGRNTVLSVVRARQAIASAKIELDAAIAEQADTSSSPNFNVEDAKADLASAEKYLAEALAKQREELDSAGRAQEEKRTFAPRCCSDMKLAISHLEYDCEYDTHYSVLDVGEKGVSIARADSVPYIRFCPWCGTKIEEGKRYAD